MYVCLCHAVSDSDIQKVVRNGVRNMQELNERLKVATCCGACSEAANECLANALVQEVDVHPAGDGD